jgi:membrane associated rhomboid family serine protease
VAASRRRGHRRTDMSKAGASSGEGRRTRLRELRDAPVTVLLGAICVVAFVGTLGHCLAQTGDLGALWESAWSLGACSASLDRAGALNLGRVWVDGEWWRLSSAGLLHGSWLHLILNVWSLVVVGPWVERAWGSMRTLVLFALASLLGCAASVAWAEAPVVVGASAGILGMAGALFVGRRFGSGEVQDALAPVSARSLGWAIAVLVGLGFAVPIIAQAGHLGGLGGGMLLGLAWRRGRRAGGWGVPLVAGVLALLVQAGRAPVGRPGYHEFTGARHLERSEFPGAARAFEEALRLAPDDPALQNAVAYAFAEAGMELERAEVLVRQALEVEPDNADFLDTLGWILCRGGRVEEGREILGKASEGSGGSVPEIEEHLEQCGRP